MRLSLSEFPVFRLLSCLKTESFVLLEGQWNRLFSLDTRPRCSAFERLPAVSQFVQNDETRVAENQLQFEMKETNWGEEQAVQIFQAMKKTEKFVLSGVITCL